MNSRIKELAEEAEDLVDWGDPMDHDHYSAARNEWQEKFSELIIKECIKVGCNAMYNDHSKVQTFPSKAIKDHFGVKQ